MTEEELFAASERLSKMQEQFIEGMRLQIATMKALTERIRSFQDYLETLFERTCSPSVGRFDSCAALLRTPCKNAWFGAHALPPLAAYAPPV